MTTHDFLDILRRRLVTAVVVALVVLAGTCGLTLLVTPQYSATTRVFFAVQGSESVTDIAQGSTFAEKQMTSYAEVATSPLVLAPVISELRLETTAELLASKVAATVPLDTVILEISVEDTSAEQSAAIANAIGAQVSKVSARLSPERQDGTESVRATTLASATIPTMASSPQVLRNLILGGAVGLLLALGIAVLRDVADTRVRSEQDLRSISESPILGVIAFDGGLPAHPLVIRDDPHSAAAEAVRRLRTNLQFIEAADRPRSIVITSSVAGEGKTTTAMNLAVSLSDAGSRVILIDADLRRPSVAEYLGLEGGVGLTTVLIGKASVSDVIQPWRESSLDILPSGQVPPNPSELLGSKAMVLLLKQLTSSYDLVLMDSPPLLPVTDSVVLAKLSGGAVVLVGADRLQKAQLRSAIGSLETADAHLFGLIMNKIDRHEASTYGYRYDGVYKADKEEISDAVGREGSQSRVDARGTHSIASGSLRE